MGLGADLNTVLQGSTTLDRETVFRLAREEASRFNALGWKMVEGRVGAHDLILYMTQSTLGHVGRGLLKDKTRTPIDVFVGDEGMTQGPNCRKVIVGLGPPDELDSACLRQVFGVPVGVRGIRPYRIFLDSLQATLSGADPSAQLVVGLQPE